MVIYLLIYPQIQLILYDNVQTMVHHLQNLIFLNIHKKITFLDDEHIIFLYAKRVPKLAWKMQKAVFTSLPERLYRVHQRMRRKHVARTTR